VNRIYTPAHIRFLGNKIAGRSYKEVTRLFNGRFGLSATPAAIRSLLTKNGLRNNRGRGVPREERRKYLPHHIRFLKGIVRGRSYAEITGMFNREFGFAISVKAMGSLLKKNNLKNGRDGRFPPGLVPHNRGKKGYRAAGCEKGWFRPGNRPQTWQPVGTEITDMYGYVKVKTRNPKTWKFKHRLIWEKENGPVPEGCAVIFADGDKRNFKPGNLVLVSRKELAVLNRLNMLSSKNEDITKISVGIARLKVLISGRKRDTLKTRGRKKLVILDNRGSRIVIACDRKTGGYFPVRETEAGPRRLRASLKPRKTPEEARDDLTAYALKRGWQRV
jgi:hypothetical protein